jgi:hypothetical protein
VNPIAIDNIEAFNQNGNPLKQMEKFFLPSSE